MKEPLHPSYQSLIDETVRKVLIEHPTVNKADIQMGVNKYAGNRSSYLRDTKALKSITSSEKRIVTAENRTVAIKLAAHVSNMQNDDALRNEFFAKLRELDARRDESNLNKKYIQFYGENEDESLPAELQGVCDSNL